MWEFVYFYGLFCFKTILILYSFENFCLFNSVFWLKKGDILSDIFHQLFIFIYRFFFFCLQINLAYF